MGRNLLRPLGERVVLLGDSDFAARLVEEASRDGSPCRVVAVLGEDASRVGSRLHGVLIEGTFSDLPMVVNDHAARRIVVVAESELPSDALFAAKLRGVAVEPAVEFFERITGTLPLFTRPERWLVLARGFCSSRATRITKRALDVVFATLGLLLASPILLVAALAIRLESAGPILYSQMRRGRHGKLFRIWKLRSMRVDAEAATGPVWARPNDTRVTRVGRVLRRTRIDELPQLWNVLRGQMSVVGPRPERPELEKELAQQFPCVRWRTAVRPGLTGWAQTRVGYASDPSQWERKLAHDLYYIKNQSLGLDLRVLMATPSTLVRGFEGWREVRRRVAPSSVSEPLGSVLAGDGAQQAPS